MKMDLVSVSKGVVGLVFGNEVFSSDEDSYVERLLDRISNGTLAEERRSAIAELQSVVAETQAAQLAFGAIGFPVLMGVLKEERDDVEMVRGALETLVNGLTPIPHVKGTKNEVQPSKMNADLLSREAGSISLLLSLLSEDDFYVRYFTLKLLTALLANSPSRLQEAILSIPQGITQLMDMLMDREVIRNEALLLLTNLTRDAEEIQKILVFEGAFEKIFSIIKEEGGSDGGVVVQDCLVLLNNLLQNNASNQVLLRETMGFDPLISFLRFRGSSYSFTQQKTVNLLSALETINLLIKGVPVGEPGKNSNGLSNMAILVQKKILDHLLMLGVESQWAPVSVRCMALRCIGDLIAGHPKNLDAIATKVLGEEPDTELALNSLLRVIMRTSNLQEFTAADYVFKSFCEKNYDGQIMLASTLIPQPYSMTHAPLEEDVNMSFGSMLLHGFTPSENDGDLETCCRAASVLCHILKDNIQCKEKVLLIELEAPASLSGSLEPLMHRIVKYLALASPTKNKDASSSNETIHIQPIILKLLITWLSECPTAVHCFLDSRSCPHLTFLIELLSNSYATPFIKGLAALLLGECILYSENQSDSVVDEICRKVGLTHYFLKFEEMHKNFPFSSVKLNQSQNPLTRSDGSIIAEIEDSDSNPVLESVFDSQFVGFVSSLEQKIRESTVESYSRPKNKVVVVPADLDQKDGEGDREYIKRLKSFIEKQSSEIQYVIGRNTSMAEAMTRRNGSTSSSSSPSHPDRTWSGGAISERFQFEMLCREMEETSQRLEMARSENARLESEVQSYKNAESEVRSLPEADLEAELNDLLVCLGQEQSKVEKLSTRLAELGVDVDELLRDVGDDVPAEDDDEDDADGMNE